MGVCIVWSDVREWFHSQTSVFDFCVYGAQPDLDHKQKAYTYKILLEVFMLVVLTHRAS